MAIGWPTHAYPIEVVSDIPAAMGSQGMVTGRAFASSRWLSVIAVVHGGPDLSRSRTDDMASIARLRGFVTLARSSAHNLAPIRRSSQFSNPSAGGMVPTPRSPHA